MTYQKTDVLVIGAGIAGLLSAKLLSESCKVTTVTDTEKLGSGASYFPLKATLGIQTTDSNAEDKNLFKEDFVRVSGQVIDKEKMNIYIEESFGKETLLNKIGFEPQLRADKRPACFAQYSRPIHLIKDWDKSRQFVQDDFSNSPNISILTQTKVIKLFTQDDQITGALFFQQDSSGNKQYILMQAKVVILATGGIAGLYKDNLYPSSVDGSGWALANDIGSKMINTEFIQFIPSFLMPKYKVLFGEHTIKYLKNVYDDQGQDIFSDLNEDQKKALFFERSSYAPFSIDFTSSLFDIRIFETIKKGSKDVRFEYYPELYQDQEAFYTIYLDWLSKEQKINLLSDNIMISHFAHASNGGIMINTYGESSINNLYALGEVSCGVEGKNRMGGNSVGGILVFTPRAVDQILKKLSSITFGSFENLKQQSTTFLRSLSNDSSSPTASFVKKQIGNILQEYASIVRTDDGLKKALNQLQNLQTQYCVFPNNESKEGYSVYLALQASQILIKSMLDQNESMGTHYKLGGIQ